jgi:hypothetical protein
LPNVAFNATGTAGNAANVVITAGNNQVAVNGTAVAIQPTVKVTDAGGNPVVGALVTFLVTSGGGNATGLNQATDALGLASVGNWTLGVNVPNQLRATVTPTVPGTIVTGSPITFTAQSASTIGVTSAGSPQSAAGFSIAVELRNLGGTPVALAGVSLTISIASGGGTLGGTVTRVTDAAGKVNFTGLTSTTTGAKTFTITGPAGVTSVTTGSITLN